MKISIMRSVLFIAVAIPALFASVGCSKKAAGVSADPSASSSSAATVVSGGDGADIDPEKLCIRVIEIMGKEAKGKPPGDDPLKGCTVSMQQKQKQEPDMYGCMAKCAMRSDSMEALTRGCRKECSSFDKRPPGMPMPGGPPPMTPPK